MDIQNRFSRKWSLVWKILSRIFDSFLYKESHASRWYRDFCLIRAITYVYSVQRFDRECRVPSSDLKLLKNKNTKNRTLHLYYFLYFNCKGNILYLERTEFAQRKRWTELTYVIALIEPKKKLPLETSISIQVGTKFVAQVGDTFCQNESKIA